MKHGIQAAAMPVRASKRATKVQWEGMIDITQPGLSFAQPKGGIAA